MDAYSYRYSRVMGRHDDAFISSYGPKIVTNSRKFDHVTPLLHQLNKLPVKQLFYYRDAVLTNKCFNGLVSKYLVDKFTKRSSIHARHTRKRDLLYLPLYRTATGQRTFTYRGTSIWKNFDDDIINAFPSSSSSKL